jgi:cytochrome c oxidase assembly protein subunit 15
VLLVCATVVLLFAGGLVTTTKSGRAFVDWPTSDGFNMFTYPFWKAAGDKAIEHSHRLIGAVIGLITIAAAVTIWRNDRRRWVHWLAVGAVGLVIAQGILGGMRVRADEVVLARIHGCVAPVFFALVVALAAVTSKWWAAPEKTESTAATKRMFLLAVATTVMSYIQLVIGAHLRHIGPNASSDMFRLALVFHLILAAALMVQIAIFAFSVLRTRSIHASALKPTLFLLLLVMLQIGLGLWTWTLKYSWPGSVLGEWQFATNWTNTAGSLAQSMTVTAHVVNGSLILGTSLLLALRLFRSTTRSNAAPALNQALLGAAR